MSSLLRHLSLERALARSLGKGAHHKPLTMHAERDKILRSVNPVNPVLSCFVSSEIARQLFEAEMVLRSLFERAGI
jgi:hypothetical protein